jgi:acyl-CoA thioester hydrolase
VPRTTEVPIRVRSTDVDAQGITNNSRYFQYFEQARLDHLVAIGVMRSGPTTGGASRLFTIAETTCRFKAPTYHRDELVVRAWTGEVRTRSFILEFQIVRTEDQALIAEGVSALVWLDEDNRPTAMDDEVRAALEGSLLP